MISSKVMSQTIDSVKIAVNDIKTANEIFLEHKFLKRENGLLLEELSAHSLRFATAVKIDSVKIQRIEVMEASNRKLEKKSKRRLRWAIGLGVMDIILAVLLIK